MMEIVDMGNMLAMDVKSKAAVDTKYMDARVICVVDRFIVNGSSSGGHVTEASA